MKRLDTLPLVSEIVVSIGPPRHDRRLSDKILAAFTHATAQGEAGVAAVLRRALEEAERAFLGAGGSRRASGALAQADLWAEFVEARDAHRRVSERGAPDPDELAQTKAEMFEAYKRWSDA